MVFGSFTVEGKEKFLWEMSAGLLNSFRKSATFQVKQLKNFPPVKTQRFCLCL